MITAVNEFLDDLRGGRMIESPVVRVEQGQLQGRLVNSPDGKAFYSFQGIPYAKPPIGSLRFRAPQPPEPWEGIRDATVEGNSCSQMDFITNNQYSGDENCLFLNVYTPSIDGEFLPVMVYVHGGYFCFGSSSSSMHGGDFLVEKDVVVVTINYRLGVLGFLSLNTPEVPGNAGLKDIAQAIRWVKENIKSFGGNAGNLTVFGNSAGGACTSLLTASPLTKNLISKAIIQSGTALNFWVFQNNALDNAKILARELGCNSNRTDEILEFLTTTPVRDLVETINKMKSLETAVKDLQNMFTPVVEKEFPGVEAFLTESFFDLLISGRVADIPIMIGTNSLEFTINVDVSDMQLYIPHILNIEKNSPESLAIAEQLKSLYFKGTPTEEEKFQLMSDVLIKVDTHRYIQYLVNVSNKPIYLYQFDYFGELNAGYKMLKQLGLKDGLCQHADELGFLFSNDLQKEDTPTALDVKMRERLLRLWTNFAKIGNPTPDVNHYLTVTWPPVTKDNLNYLHLSNELSVKSNLDKEKMEFWENLYTKYFKIWDHPKTNEEVVIANDVVLDTTPVIVQETIIKTVTTVINENGKEIVDSQVIVDVIDSNGDHEQIQGAIIDLKNPVEVQSEVTDNSVPQDNLLLIQNNDNVAVQDNLVVDHKSDNVVVSESPDVRIEDSKVDLKHGAINIVEIQEKFDKPHNGVEGVKINGNFDKKPRPSNEIKMVQNSNADPKDVIRANDPPEDDLPKNIGVNKFVNFFESLGGKK